MYATPTPSQEDSSTTIINLYPSSTQIEAPTKVDTKIIAAVIFAAVVLLVAVTIAFMMAMLSSRSCHCSHKSRQTKDKDDQLQHEVMDDTIAEQCQNYENL